MIFNNKIGLLYAEKYNQLDTKYGDLFSQIDRAETESLLLAENALEKALIRGPRQTDLSYEKASTAAYSRHNKINLKITKRFQATRELLHTDKLKKTTKVDLNYGITLKNADKELVKNVAQSAKETLASFTSRISSLNFSYEG